MNIGDFTVNEIDTIYEGLTVRKGYFVSRHAITKNKVYLKEIKRFDLLLNKIEKLCQQSDASKKEEATCPKKSLSE